MTTDPTPEQIGRAAVKWCREKERETGMDDILYFRHNWRALPGLKAYVVREVSDT
jgi:hypothetical protein